ncbi:K02A2.6-like [Cordylochernes scorpioides]|uniref:K02A2.6-like n=1 Tax=Cordylochernes scorpioides TaxID=51811 RepID=A0ABY6LNI7_9ARAC|nr:K02A2.6-like [Cordylochernes scorpioides]
MPPSSWPSTLYPIRPILPRPAPRVLPAGPSTVPWATATGAAIPSGRSSDRPSTSSGGPPTCRLGSSAGRRPDHPGVGKAARLSPLCPGWARWSRGPAHRLDDDSPRMFLLYIIQTSFWNVFAQAPSSAESIADFLAEVTPLEFDEWDQLFLADIYRDQIAACIHSLPNGHGLPCEYAKAFEDFFAEVLWQVFEASRLRGTLPSSSRRSKVILLPKSNGGPNLQAFRPINLPTTDYRVLSGVLMGRLRRHLPYLVPDCQIYAVPGRSSSWNIAQVADSVAWAARHDTPLAVISLVLKSAFDTLSRSYLFALLEKLGLPSAFLGWITVLYGEADASIRIGDVYTRAFPLLNGVRQGCRLSAALFSIGVGSLLRRLERILGRGSVVAYADDIVLFIRDDAQFELVPLIFEEFRMASGVAVNFSKSCGLWCGSWRHRTDSPLGISWTTESLNILGCTITAGNTASHLIGLLERAIEGWSPFVRGLSLVGRVRAANCLALGSILHHLHGYVPPETTIGRLQARLARFVWVSEGGVGLLDIAGQLRLACLKGVQASLRGAANGYSWLVRSRAWLTPPAPVVWLSLRRRRLLSLWEAASSVLELDHRVLHPAILRSLRLRGDNRFLRPLDLLAPERWLQVFVGDFSDGVPALTRSTRAALLDAQHLGTFCQRLLQENSSSSYHAEYEAETIVLTDSTTPITRLNSQSAPRALDAARLQAHPAAELAARMEGIKPPAEFVPYSNEKKWETWRESFEIFAIAVNLESMPLVRQRAILKHIAGEKTVMIYKTFHISENDTYPNVKEMLDMFTNHFKPFKNTIQRRNAFFTCVQKERQGIMEFVWHKNNLTESLIRDRIIIGILDREVKRKLLEDPQLTLPRAISIAMISESTCSQVASLNEQKMIEKIEKRNWVKDTIRMENAEAGPSGINPRRERIIEPCKWCGQRHKYGKCPAYGKKCNAWGKPNHFSVVCRTKRIRNLLAESEAEESCDEINLNEVAVKTVRSDKWSAVIIINGKKTTVHLDTGAQINVLPHKVINQWPSRPEIRPTSLKAFAYGNTELSIVGKCNVLCQYGEKKGMFEFIVADVEAQTLITGDTCEKLEILRRINHINTDEMKLCSETQKILEQYHEVFQGVGLINSECKIYTKPEYSPVQVPPRRIPTSLGAEVQSELEKMVKQGIVTKIYHETEICLDPRKLNEALVGRHFQTPAPAELLHEIPKAKYYTVLDVKSAYWHIPVAKECRDLLVMTTPFGKFRYNRLPFGLKISAQIFVEKMTNIFRDSFQNITYVDDLLIYADTIQEHNKKLKGILEKAKENNIKFDLTKAQICLTKVRFLGHLISQNGIDPEPNKIDKLITFKRPEDKKSLQRIMGLYNYLGKFIPNLAASTSNIRGILRKNVVWHWGPKQEGEFDHIKECVRNAPSLAHFDKSKMLILQCDASKDAMGAALLQEDRPLAFASASFSDSQEQYSQIEKELLSAYYGCKKFEYLLSGHTFVVQTDHQPLLPLVKKPLSDISPRLQRLVMKLIAFDFKLQYKPGKYLIVADTLSRDTHPMDELPTPFLEDKRMVKMVRVNISDEKLVAMQKDTREDPALVKVIDYVIEGWPICKKDVDEDAKVFSDFRHRLYLWNDLLCIGSAIVIPKTQRNNMLNLLHQSHQGISAIQGLARESLFWPSTLLKKNQKYVPVYPWQTVSLDIFYIQKKPHLLVVDRYSGYPEVFTLDPPTAINVKNKLRETFARFGIPETMMSDNGPPFRSEIMTDFCIRWGIKQLFSSPHLHRSNGLAERNIQTIKNQLIKCRDEGSDPYLAILAYRNTPKNDLPSLAQLCLSRSLRCQIPRITPLYRPYQTNWRSIENAKRKRQSSMKEQYDRNTKSYPKVNVGQDAWCQIHPRETWTPVKISAQADSPQSFEVVTPSGNRLIRNQQFIRPRDGVNEKSQLSSEHITASPEAQHPHCDSPTMGESSTAPIQRSSEETNIDQREGATTSAGISPEPSGRPRFSRFGRELRKPQRFCF